MLDGLNRYAYVGGNPESRMDPSGHEEIELIDSGFRGEGEMPGRGAEGLGVGIGAGAGTLATTLLAAELEGEEAGASAGGMAFAGNASVMTSADGNAFVSASGDLTIKSGPEAGIYSLDAYTLENDPLVERYLDEIDSTAGLGADSQGDLVGARATETRGHLINAW